MADKLECPHCHAYTSAVSRAFWGEGYDDEVGSTCPHCGGSLEDQETANQAFARLC